MMVSDPEFLIFEIVWNIEIQQKERHRLKISRKKNAIM